MNIKNLKEEQRKFSQKIDTKRSEFDKRYIAGCVNASKNGKMYSNVTLFDYQSISIKEESQTVKKHIGHYIKGFTAFQEGPIIVESLNKLKIKPDIVMVLGNGILNQGRFGLACFVGLAVDIPTIGISKNLELGAVKDGKVVVNLEARGREIITKEGARPLYVSVGNKISLAQSVSVVKEMLRLPHKLPEPLHISQKNLRRILKFS